MLPSSAAVSDDSPPRNLPMGKRTAERRTGASDMFWNSLGATQVYRDCGYVPICVTGSNVEDCRNRHDCTMVQSILKFPDFATRFQLESAPHQTVITFSLRASR